MGFVHALTHSHARVTKDGVGTIATCSRRWGGKAAIHFRPDFEGAQWWEVPGADILQALAAARDAYEAMSILRAVS